MKQLNRPGITVGRMFGSPVLKVAGKVFATLVKGRLVVKLPKPRVEDLRPPGGKPFDPGHGKAVEGVGRGRCERQPTLEFADRFKPMNSLPPQLSDGGGNGVDTGLLLLSPSLRAEAKGTP